MSDIFENLKSTWKEQPISSLTVNLSTLQEKAEATIQQQQKQLVFTNLKVSVAFALVFIMLGLFWNYFPARTPYFYGGMGFMALVMFLFSGTMWLSVQYKNINSFQDHQQYIQSNIRKLKLRKWMMTTGIWVYFLLMTAAFYCYFVDVLAGVEIWFKVIAYLSIPAYMLLIVFITRKKNKVQLEQINRLLEDLEKWKEQL